jgi:hypothetical protein
MIRQAIAVINDFSGGQDTKTPIVSMGLNKSPNMRNFHCAGVKERLMKRGGFAKLNSSQIDTDDLDVHYSPGYQTHDYALRDTADRTEISQGFKCATSSTVTKVRLWLKKTGTPAGTDTVTLEIQTDSSGVPSGVAVTDGTATAVDISDTLTTSYAWVTFTFASNPTLTAGTQYHLVLQGAFTISNVNYVLWGVDHYDVVYPDGLFSKNDGVIWTNDENYIGCFEVYITGGSQGNIGVSLFDFSSKGMLLGFFGTSLYKMNKNSASTPDGIWIPISNYSEFDYMEYASHALAQMAYVSDDTGNSEYITQSSDGSATTGLGDVSGAEWRIAQTFTLTETMLITGVSFSFGANNGAPAGNVTARIETLDGSGDPSGSLADANLTKAISPTPSDWNDFTFTTPAVLAAGSYAIKLNCDNQTTDNYWTINRVTPSAYSGGLLDYYNGSSWNKLSGYDNTFKIYTAALQCFSESTIKNQGNYSLKVLAMETDSLNDTLTRTIGSPIDLSGRDEIKFDIYASRTGANIKIGIHDSGGTTSEKTYTVIASNTWETVTWDISAVADADKDAIDSIIITILNADADNTFYIDNFRITLNGGLTSSRFWTFGDWQSGTALINTDIGLYSYTGTGDLSIVSAAPLGKFMTIWRNYVFIVGVRASPNTVRYSDLSDYTTWTASNTLNFDTNDGDIITGIRMLKGKLFVFKRYSVHRITYLGSNPTFQVDPILGIGSPSHYTIKEVDMGGELGSVLVFLTTDKKLAIFDGYNVQILNDNLTEESNDLFASADDQPISFSDMNLTYADLFHAVVKHDSYEYILYCVLGSDTTVGYAFVLDYKTGGIYPYDNQVFASSCYVMSTNKTKIPYASGYTGYTWQLESGDSDDGSDINSYWVSGKIKPALVSLLTKALQLGVNLKEITSASTLNLSFQFRIDWNVSWTTAENFNYDHNDELAFGKTALFDIGTINNMLQIKIKDDSSNPAPTLYGIDLYGQQTGLSVGDRAVA